MKCNPWRWLWGLIPILMLGWIAVLAEHERIEADLTDRTRTVLQRSGFGWADIRFEGRDAVLTGRAFEDGEPARAAAAALDTMGVRVVDNQAGLQESFETYAWSAIRRGNRIRLDGTVPSEKTRRDVMGMARASFPGLEVDDRLRLARGGPPLDVWLGGVSYGLKQLSLLSEGRVDLEEASLSVSGDARDTRSYRALRTALSSQVPPGIKLKREAVRPPLASPYAWSAQRQGSEVILLGHVPSDQIGEDLRVAAQRRMANAKVVDRMEPASGAPDDFIELALALIEQLGRLDEGTAQVRDRVVMLNGVAASAERAEEVRQAMGRATLAAFRTGGEIVHRGPRIKPVSPFTTAIHIDDAGVRLSGYVPDDTARQSINTWTRQAFAGRGVRDDMQVGAGQPPGWERCVEVGIHALRQLGSGSAEIVDRQLRIAGTAASEAMLQSLPAEIRGRAGMSCDVDVRLSLSAAVAEAREDTRLRAEQDMRAKEEAERQAREEAARRQAEEDRRRAAELARAQERAEDERREAQETARLRAEQLAQERAEDERRKAQEAARLRAEQLAQERAEDERRKAQEAARLRAEQLAQERAEDERRKAQEAARLRAEQLAQERAEDERRKAQETARLRAEQLAQERAEDERRKAQEAARLRAEQLAQERAEDERRRAQAKRPPRTEVERREEQQVVDACQEAMSRVAREGVINFRRASFDLDPSSFATLNRVAEAANRCPSVIVEIEGHTNSEGTPERNQRLSDRRANAVKTYLIKAGVDESRLIAVGYGQDRNIASNDTPEGRAQNRRIEFVVKMAE